MKRKEREVENLIYSGLNAEKPDESVLNAAKTQMTAARTESGSGGAIDDGVKCRNGGGTIAVNPLAKRRAVVAAVCAVFAVVIVLCCSLPFVLRGEEIAGDDEFTPREIESIKSYDDSLLSLGYEVESCVLYSDYDDSPVYILELYNDNQTRIALYVLLDTTKTNISVLSAFSGLTQSYTYSGIAVSYGICGDEYAAAFTYSGCNYYISAEVSEDNQILSYAQELLKAG